MMRDKKPQDVPKQPPVKPIPKAPSRMSAAKSEKKGILSFFPKKHVGPGPVADKPKEPKPKTDILKPFKEELTYEWKWLLKKLHIYDYDKEDANLAAYRKLRGWE